MKKIKLICILLSLSTCVVLFSCATLSSNEKKEGTKLDPSETTVIADTTQAFIEPNVPDKNYNGAPFKILYPNWSMYNFYYFAEEETGDAINDALYNRKIKIEEKLNIKFEEICPGYIDKIEPTLKKSVLAGDDAYDLVLTHCLGMESFVANNLVSNWNDIPSIDFSKPYWNQNMNKTLQINNFLPFAASDYIIPDSNSIFFNKKMINEYKLENPYDLVRSGKWTWDKLSEMSKVVSKDLDGDGEFTQEDQYGFAGELDWQFISIMYSCDQYMVKTDSSGLPSLDINNEKMYSIVKKIYDLAYTDNKSFLYKYEAKINGTPYIGIDSGRALFCLLPLNTAQDQRNTDVDFGILPFPKYDETQKQYITNNWNGLMAVPITVKDMERVGIVSELLAAESMRTVMPAFYDILLNSKIARDEDSAEMLDIIFGKNPLGASVYDFGMNYNNDDLLYMIPNLIKAKSTDVASYYAKREVASNKKLKKVYDTFIDNE